MARRSCSWSWQPGFAGDAAGPKLRRPPQRGRARAAEPPRGHRPRRAERPLRSADRAQDLVLSLWSRTRLDWGFAATRLGEALRRERALSSLERRWVIETLYGLIRQARRLEFALAGQE